MKLSELINRLEEIKESEGDMDVACYDKDIDWYLDMTNHKMNVENVEHMKKDTKVCPRVKTDLALFIG